MFVKLYKSTNRIINSLLSIIACSFLLFWLLQDRYDMDKAFVEKSDVIIYQRFSKDSVIKIDEAETEIIKEWVMTLTPIKRVGAFMGEAPNIILSFSNLRISEQLGNRRNDFPGSHCRNVSFFCKRRTFAEL